MADLVAALQEAERANKKQRITTESTVRCIDDLLDRLHRTRKQLREGPTAGSGYSQEIVQGLVKGLDAHTKVATHQKDVYNSVSKLGKLVEKACIPDVCKAYRRDLVFNHQVLDKVIAQHFFREGRFHVGSEFCREAGLKQQAQIMAPFLLMHEILKAIYDRDLQPALQWVNDNYTKLSHTGKLASFHFQLHKQQYIHILVNSGPAEALKYAKSNFKQFGDLHMGEIQRLMGCLLFVNRLDKSPYSDLLSESTWKKVGQEFVRQCCGLLGQASDSPLLVTVSAGAAALPQLLKLTNLLKEKGQDIMACDELPVELELGQEFVFHSIFACPVSREQSSAENPPTMLPCGHVLCKQSVLKIAKGTTRSFKCPYCPMEAQQSSCRHIQFPDVIA